VCPRLDTGNVVAASRRKGDDLTLISVPRWRY